MLGGQDLQPRAFGRVRRRPTRRWLRSSRLLDAQGFLSPRNSPNAKHFHPRPRAFALEGREPEAGMPNPLGRPAPEPSSQRLA